MSRQSYWVRKLVTKNILISWFDGVLSATIVAERD